VGYGVFGLPVPDTMTTGGPNGARRTLLMANVRRRVRPRRRGEAARV
jgi:hypothetical protein